MISLCDAAGLRINSLSILKHVAICCPDNDLHSDGGIVVEQMISGGLVLWCECGINFKF